MISSLCAAGKGSGLKNFWPAALLVLLIVLIALFWPSSHSGAVWLSLQYPSSSASLTAPDFAHIAKPSSSSPELGQQNKSVYQLEEPHLTIAPSQGRQHPLTAASRRVCGAFDAEAHGVHYLQGKTQGDGFFAYKAKSLKLFLILLKFLYVCFCSEPPKISPDSEFRLEVGDSSLNASDENSPHVLEAVDSNQLDSEVQAGKAENISNVEEFMAPLEHHAGVPDGHDSHNEEESTAPPEKHHAGVPEGRDSHKPLRTEQELLAAKRAIANAVLDADTNLHAPLYHNLTTFIKSYELMEQMFQIYIYKEGSPPFAHTGPIVGIYASEGRFIQQLQSSKQFATSDPTKAHLFFLPYSGTNLRTLYVPGSHSMQPLTHYITSYVDLISSKYTYWNLSHGADHFFVSCHDWGPATARKHLELRRNAIKVVCNADVTEEFVIGKDVSLPETYMHAAKPPTKLGGLPIRKRPYLAFFAGQMHGRVRPVLLDFWKDKDKDMKIYEKIPGSRSTKKGAYVRFMRTSKFCICPMGYEVNSPRIVESIYYDCVPVIIADNFVLPFNEVLNWQAFSVSVAERDIPNLKQILLSIPERKYAAMQVNLKHVRQHFSWHYRQPMKYDVFHMILHSLWLRRLASVSTSIS